LTQAGALAKGKRSIRKSNVALVTYRVIRDVELGYVIRIKSAPLFSKYPSDGASFSAALELVERS
jgi:hypothetical protein